MESDGILMGDGSNSAGVATGDVVYITGKKFVGIQYECSEVDPNNKSITIALFNNDYSEYYEGSKMSAYIRVTDKSKTRVCINTDAAASVAGIISGRYKIGIITPTGMKIKIKRIWVEE